MRDSRLTTRNAYVKIANVLILLRRLDREISNWCGSRKYIYIIAHLDSLWTCTAFVDVYCTYQRYASYDSSLFGLRVNSLPIRSPRVRRHSAVYGGSFVREGAVSFHEKVTCTDVMRNARDWKPQILRTLQIRLEGSRRDSMKNITKSENTLSAWMRSNWDIYPNNRSNFVD